jgi:hypothetical protein
MSNIVLGECEVLGAATSNKGTELLICLTDGSKLVFGLSSSAQKNYIKNDYYIPDLMQIGAISLKDILEELDELRSFRCKQLLAEAVARKDPADIKSNFQ